jgi:glycosyltransferase involved in cell wall biosynthesis
MSNTPKYVYAHTPARYIWEPDLDERGNRLVPQLVSPFLRALDRHRASEHTNVAANSQFVQKRIRATWELDATVLYPPVDVKRIQATGDWTSQTTHAEQALLDSLPSQFILGASRFVSYKRLDRVIEMGERAGVPVVIAGNGPDKARLEAQATEANVAVSFVESPSDALLFCLYDRALAYVFPGVEDFGIMPVEAMAAGVPVIVNREGGASESVIDGVTGVHFDFEDISAADAALAAAASLSREECRKRARDFSREIFEENLRQWMGEP